MSPERFAQVPLKCDRFRLNDDELDEGLPFIFAKIGQRLRRKLGSVFAGRWQAELVHGFQEIAGSLSGPPF